MPRHVEKSPITLLAEALKNATALKGVATVLVGVDHLAKDGAPPRIVLFPVNGPFRPADSRDCTVGTDLTVAAHVWDATHDHAYDLQQRLFRALEEQAADGGLFWKPGDGSWERDPDTANQGHAVVVTFVVRLNLERASLTTGRVDSVSFQQKP
jgi:hypothetical protein